MGLCQCNITGHGTDSEMFVTAEEFADRLDRQASKSKGKTGEEPRHSKERKGTGFITKAMMMDILSKVEDEGDEEEIQSTAEAVSGTGPARRNSRCKELGAERKGTGYVSKDKLQKILAAAGEEE
eukprot:s1505_g11.t1